MPCCIGDHPRVCGEHLDELPISGCQAGSSPRVRGTPWLAPLGGGEMGIIPACAGNTRSVPQPWALRRDDPRVCGEHMPDTVRTSSATGSSPRVRGTHDSLRLAIVDSADHPRVCGEHATAPSNSAPFKGSSPRVRGTREIDAQQPIREGIIPACAGNTFGPRYGRRKTWDHPRVCGEHAWSAEQI